jgi:hypothetical protein
VRNTPSHPAHGRASSTLAEEESRLLAERLRQEEDDRILALKLRDEETAAYSLARSRAQEVNERKDRQQAGVQTQRSENDELRKRQREEMMQSDLELAVRLKLIKNTLIQSNMDPLCRTLHNPFHFF